MRDWYAFPQRWVLVTAREHCVRVYYSTPPYRCQYFWHNILIFYALFTQYIVFGESITTFILFGNDESGKMHVATAKSTSLKKNRHY